ncbi:MAG: type VI secretion system baseplate subunit TssG [bacterium]
MGTDPGRNFTRLIEDLTKNAPSYNVWYAVYLSEIITKKLHPDRKDFMLDQKGLSFKPYENYVFPPKDIRSVSFEEDTITFILNFLGLYGINSPLPRCYHEQIPLQQNVYSPGNVPLQNFLDIFNNRFYWLYYQSWKKYRFNLYFKEGFENKVIQRINSFTGISSSSQENVSHISPFSRLVFSGILCQRVRNKAGLSLILSNYFFNYNVKIKEFIPKWVKLSEIPKMGGNDEDSHRLGLNSFIGESALDYMSRICIEIGPISYEDFLKFTPLSTNALQLKELLELYLNDGLEFDVKIKIKTETITTDSWADDRLRLGKNLWLGKPEHEFVDVYYPYEEYAA